MLFPNNQEVKPLTLASPPLHIDQQPDRRGGRCRLWCCGCCVVTILVIGITILILSFTAFKVKDPELTLNALYLDNLNLGFRNLQNPLSVNGTLTADISIKNPNVAAFRFHNSTTEFYYEGVTVGVAYAGSGKVKADRTVRMNVTVDVLADQVGLTNATRSALVDGTVNVTTFTDVSGKVIVVGIYKKHMRVEMNCSVTLQVTTQVQEMIKSKVCVTSVM